MRRLRRFFKRSTPEAKLLKKALEGHGIRVLTEVYDGYKHVDLGIPDAHINIEIDGRQHLTNSRQILADLDRGHYSEGLGYSTIHIHNQEIKDDLPAIAKALAQAARLRAKRFSAED